MRHSLDDVFYGIEALKTRYDPVEEECFDDPSTPKEPVDYEALDKGMEALEFEAEAIQTKSDLVLTCMEEMTAYQDYIRRNGIDRASLSLLNRNNRFSRYLNVTLPACESMTTVGSPYSELSLICMEGIGKTLKKFGKVLWKTIKAVFKWITTPFRALWKKIREAWKESGKKKCHIGTKEDIKKTIKALVEATGTILKQYGKKKFDADKFKEEAKEILKGALKEKIYYVDSKDVNEKLTKSLSNDASTLIEAINALNTAIDNLSNGGNVPDTTDVNNKLTKIQQDLWTNDKTKITESNPDESTKIPLHLNIVDSSFNNVDKTLSEFDKKAAEHIQKIDKFIAGNNSPKPTSGSQPSGTGNNNGAQQQQQEEVLQTSNSDQDNKALEEVKNLTTKIQGFASFMAGCFAKSVQNSGKQKKYSGPIQKLIKNALADYEVPPESQPEATQKLDAEYHKRISIYFGEQQATPQNP